MRILFIGPLPDPVTGHSLACKIFLEELIQHHQVEVVNLSKNSFKEGVNGIKRILEVIDILRKINRKKKNADLIYLTISESFAGNLKDILIYLLCFKSLSRMIIHLHGGSIKKLLFDKNKLLFRLNAFFIRRLGGVIVLGPTHVDIFSGLISANKIYIVPNFSEDYLFVTQDLILNKFKNTDPLRILFLSNFISGKGFDEMIDAYLDLSEDLKKRVVIDFAGAFESDIQKIKFLSRVDSLSQIYYHGVVEGTKKKDLLSRAHIFCLPTALNEGQPISILEAYASGCVVITTDQGGIRDVFRDKVSGFKVEVKSMKSLSRVFDQCIRNSDMLMPIAMVNFNTAHQQYKTSHYRSSLMKIVDAVYDSKVKETLHV